MRSFLLSLNFIESGELLTDLDELDIFVAIIHVVIFGELACVGFPTEVAGVDGLNSCIHFVRWHMSMMQIHSLTMSPFVHNDI